MGAHGKILLYSLATEITDLLMYLFGDENDDISGFCIIILSFYFLHRVSLFMRLCLGDDYGWKCFIELKQKFIDIKDRDLKGQFLDI